MPGEDQEGVERRKSRAEIAQAEHAAGNGKRKVAEGLVQDDALIFRARLRQHRITSCCAPIEGAAVDDQAANGIAVAADKFGERMHDNVGAEIDRLAQVRRRKRIVDDERYACLARNL